VSITDTSTGIVYETAAALMAEVERIADERHGKPCPHGLRVPCRRCEHPDPPRRVVNTWSDEREAGSSTSSEGPKSEPQRDPALASRPM
jgi:hypothetical protein